MFDLLGSDWFTLYAEYVKPEDLLVLGLLTRACYNLIFNDRRMSQTYLKKYVVPHLIENKNSQDSVTEHEKILDYVKDIITKSKIKRAITSGKNVFVTGPGGTGKTTLLDEICINFDITKGEYQTASTGTAASALSDGRTLHSLFNKFTIFPKELKPHDPSGSYEYIKEIAKHKVEQARRRDCSTTDALRKIKKIRIDEVSMFSYFYFQYLHELMTLVKPDCDPNLPFGGVQIILSGDFAQLRPVPQKEPKNNDTEKFIYLCSFWKNHVKVFNLRFSFRQLSDPQWASVCYATRHGIISKNEIKVLQSRIIKDEKEIDPKAIHIYTTNDMVNKYNKSALDKIDSPEVHLKRDFWYVHRCENQGKKEKCSVPSKDNHKELEKFFKERSDCEAIVTLKVGAVAMLTKNIDIGKQLVNGTHGTIRGIKHKEIIIKNFAFEGRTSETIGTRKDFRVKFEVSKTGKVEEIGAHQRFIREPCGCTLCLYEVPLKLASAITAHKSQGMTLSSVHANINEQTSSALIYVILTRVSGSKNITFGKNFNPTGIDVDKEIKKFYSGERRIGKFQLEDEEIKQEEEIDLDELDKQLDEFIDSQVEEKKQFLKKQLEVEKKKSENDEIDETDKKKIKLD